MERPAIRMIASPPNLNLALLTCENIAGPSYILDSSGVRTLYLRTVRGDMGLLNRNHDIRLRLQSIHDRLQSEIARPSVVGYLKDQLIQTRARKSRGTNGSRHAAKTQLGRGHQFRAAGRGTSVDLASGNGGISGAETNAI